MNYIGSKRRLSAFIRSVILRTVAADGKSLRDCVFAELFGGTGIISRGFKPEVKQVIINDLEPYSYVLCRNYIGNHRPFDFREMIRELGSLRPQEGFIYQHYCAGSGSGRLYFTDANGKRIDAIRSRIEAWKVGGAVTDDQYYFLLASLIEAADKVANTASVYGAFLKRVKPSAQKSLALEPALFSVNDNGHLVFNQDANQLIHQIKGDILYLDPPYNGRQYGANYHLLNTIALYDDFEPRGKTGLRDYRRSRYCRGGQVAEAFEELIRHADFRYVFVSYNNEGLMDAPTVASIMSRYGRYELATTHYQRFKADTDQNRTHQATATTEHLHILVKDE
ncbi:MAG: DNA adenine methylase [Ferruginibacter sp.]|nr:DNA adenine methylase [Cytophagales bacterium]